MHANNYNTAKVSLLMVYLNMAAVVHFAVDWSQVAVSAKPGQSLPFFHSNCRLRKVEVILIGQLDDVMMMKEGESDG